MAGEGVHPCVLARIYPALKAKTFEWASLKAFGNHAQSSGGFPCALSPRVPPLRLALMPVLFPHLVEDKVKDQLEAAKPEPIIDEVVRMFRAALRRVRLICVRA